MQGRFITPVSSMEISLGSIPTRIPELQLQRQHCRDLPTELKYRVNFFFHISLYSAS
jgi:hypothetical protein